MKQTALICFFLFFIFFLNKGDVNEIIVDVSIVQGQLTNSKALSLSMCTMISQFGVSLYSPLNLKVCLNRNLPPLSVKTQEYKKYLINLVFSVCSMIYGPSFLPLRFVAQKLHFGS